MTFRAQSQRRSTKWTKSVDHASTTSRCEVAWHWNASIYATLAAAAVLGLFTPAGDLQVATTQASETTAPESKSPESKSAESKSPESKSPESKSPESKPPESKSPESKSPTTKPIDSKLSAGDERFYLEEIKPLLVAKCVSCHGPEKQEGALRLDSLAAALRGGDRGPAVVRDEEFAGASGRVHGRRSANAAEAEIVSAGNRNARTLGKGGSGGAAAAHRVVRRRTQHPLGTQKRQRTRALGP